MNFILHKHNRPDHHVTLPTGLRELMMDISREVLREQPAKITEFIANYLDALLVVRENTYISKHTLDDLIQFTMDMAQLMQMSGMSESKAKAAANYLRTELKMFTEANCVTEFSEKVILEKLVNDFGLDRTKAMKVQKVIEESFKGYFYRYISYRDAKHGIFGIAWQQAVEHTLNIYRLSKPEQSAMDRAATVIQAAYRGFYGRRLLARKEELTGAALTIQKVFRGYAARRRLSSMREQTEDLKRQSDRVALLGYPTPYENLDGVSLDYSSFSLK